MKTKEVKSPVADWELKDRTYLLKGRSPLTYKIRTQHLLWFDENLGINRELRYATNQNTLFVDEQDDHVVLGHVVFQDGVLYVPKTQPMLQQLLSYYHPKAGQLWEELDEAKEAEDEVEVLEHQLKALNLVGDLDIDHLEAIMRSELGSSVTTLTSKELKRDAYRFAKTDPKLFLELSADEDLKLRNLANRSVEAGILKLTEDGTVFKLASNGKKMMTVPFDQNPYAALAQYFKTDDGVTLMKSIIKKLD